MEPSHDEALKRSLARLDVATLVERANDALDVGEHEKALLYLRTAVRRAPLRRDLREMLVAAAEKGVERGRRGQGGPQAVPRIPRRPLFEDEPPRPDDEEPPPIEEVRSDEEDTAELEFEGRIPRVPVPRHAPRQPLRSSYQERHERGPAGAAIFAIGLAALLATAVAVAAVWFYVNRSTLPAPGATGKPRVDLAAARNAELIEKAKDYEQQSQFAMAIEQLELLSDTPEKKRLLAEAYGRRGDYYTRHNRFNEAREGYQRALEYDPKSAQYAFDLGSTLYLLGRRQQALDRDAAQAKFADAERYLKTAVELNPAFPEALYRLADIEIARGNSPGAFEYLRQIIERFADSREAQRARNDLQQMGLKP